LISSRIVALTLGVLIASAAPAGAQVMPAGPRVLIDTTYGAPTGRTLAVAAGGDVQGALNSAQPGDVITLAAGATYTGNYVLPMKSGTGWVTVRTSTPEGTFVAPGTRVSPGQAGQMAKLVSVTTDPVLQWAPGAHHYRLIGLELTVGAGHYIDTLVAIGTGSDTSVAALPHDIIIDRCYVHGDATVGSKRGVGLNGGATAVVDSYFADWKGQGFDTQAIAGWNGTGPYKIVNNYLEGAGENFIYGGADPHIANQVAADFEIRRNHFAKPVSWNPADAGYGGTHWSVKNLFELKNARRVLLDGNLLEHVWADAQVGYAILLTPRNQDGTAPWSVVEDVTITNNIIRHAEAGVQLLGWDNNNPSGQLNRVVIRNNVFDDLGWGRLVQPEDGTANVTIEHNTGFPQGPIIAAGGRPHTGWTYRNNLTLSGNYGIIGTGTPTGTDTITTYFPSLVFAKNVIVGASAGQYPTASTNYFPASTAEVGFVNEAGGNYRLTATSPYKNAGTDGKDIGADLDAIAAAMAGGAAPTPAPVTPSPVPAGTGAGTLVPDFSGMPSGALLSWTASIFVGAQGAVGNANTFTLFVDGRIIGTSAVGTPWTSFAWDTTREVNGVHTLRLDVTDASGNGGTSTLVVRTDNVNAPAGTVVPAAGTLVPDFSGMLTGTIMTWTASVNVGVKNAVGPNTFTLTVDGVPIGTTTAGTAWTNFSWNTQTVSNGSHTLTLGVTDSTGNTGTASVNVQVAN
jgi:hypothetical protein